MDGGFIRMFLCLCVLLVVLGISAFDMWDRMLSLLRTTSSIDVAILFHLPPYSRAHRSPILFLVQPSAVLIDAASLSNRYGFQKPNDVRALNLMNAAAAAVMKELPDLCISYGVSDEYR
jgi:tRNAHis guanylyltransferase